MAEATFRFFVANNASHVSPYPSRSVVPHYCAVCGRPHWSGSMTSGRTPASRTEQVIDRPSGIEHT